LKAEETENQELIGLPVDISAEVKKMLSFIPYNFYCILKQAEIGILKAEETANQELHGLPVDVSVEVKKML
jgi:hypothetical protein